MFYLVIYTHIFIYTTSLYTRTSLPFNLLQWFQIKWLKSDTWIWTKTFLDMHFFAFVHHIVIVVYLLYNNGIAHYSVWTRCSSLLNVNEILSMQSADEYYRNFKSIRGPSWSYDTTSAISAYHQGIHEKLCKAEQDCFWGPRWQAKTSLKIEDLRSNKTTGKLS